MKHSVIDFNIIIQAFKENRPINKIYRGAVLLWERIKKSCFGNGYWINNNPWTNDMGWKNN